MFQGILNFGLPFLGYLPFVPSFFYPAAVRKTRQAIELAFRTQLAGLGLSLVEILAPCPVNWKLEPVKALEWQAKNMLPQYPLGEFKVIEAVTALKKGDRMCMQK